MAPGHEPSARPAEGDLGARLSAARARSFVGREAELDLFRSALVADVPPFAVLHLHGPGGVGKTALVARFADAARQAGRPAALVDGRSAAPSPAGVRAAIAASLRVAEQDGLAALSAQEAPVLLVDTWELLSPLDGWLRDTLVPQLPERSLVVLAGRRPPGPGWRADPGWDQLLRVIALRDLPADDARTLLALRGVGAARQDDALRISRGHPLALVLVAEVLAQQGRDERLALEDVPEVIETLLERFLRDVPSDRHRRALYAAAQVGVATEELLRRAVDDASAGELFDWLRDLSFTEPVARGVGVHALVADLLNADLRWRDPEAWAALHDAVSRHLRHRVLRATGLEQERAMLDSLQLYRLHPVTRPYFDGEHTHDLWMEPATPADHRAIRALVRQHEGEASAVLCDYWLRHQPEAFTVFREAGAQEPAGFVADLLLGDAPRGEVDVDPVLAAVWEHVRGCAPTRPGERLRVMRFWVARATYQDVVTHHLVSARASLDWMTTERLAWAFVVLAEADRYEPIFTFIDFARPSGLEVDVGERRYAMFARDMRTSSQRAWREMLRDRRVSSEQEVVAVPAAERRLLVLARAEFTEVVRAALRGVARPGGLEGNPLLRSRVVVENAAGRRPEEALRDLLAKAAGELATHPRDQKKHRALELTYFRPAPSQEAAAELLGLPFSTFRRHLSSGVEHVVSRLWELDLYGGQEHG